MALVGYSDSEESDLEGPQPAAPVVPPKRLERTEGKKIKVDLSSLQPQNGEQVSEPAPKRQRTGGAFSGFNSLLPAPKRTTQNALKPGVNLRTSSEAAFSRVPPPRVESTEMNGGVDTERPEVLPVVQKEEVKLIGKTTRFLPLSVTNAKKKKHPLPVAAMHSSKSSLPPASVSQVDLVPSLPQTKPKQSLFTNATHSGPLNASTTPYEPEFVQSSRVSQVATLPATASADLRQSAQDSALHDVAKDLNLSASERRRLFGRHGGPSDVKIAHFDMDSEYKSNQDAAANGDAVEHRTVRAIAPGKHSLAQLVNNVKGQTDALEDKWAEGRRNRGETGSKYGW
ncbi:hypothetical protein AMS68_005856 [Peltaster fructicola]|uniref:Uncharacterized protein n=1 Tax=Peltaster fructicola TaxID=286661 RepID=A0A6H0Y0E8_9PEZI|nr:hypothetical protein AMS68_005856 [Peltaster fructicola]